jgi:hypothetical protein
MECSVSGRSVSRPRPMAVLASNSEYRRCIATASIIHKPISERTITPAAIITSMGGGGFELPPDPISRLQTIQPKNQSKNSACRGRGKCTAWRHESEDTNSPSAPSQSSNSVTSDIRFCALNHCGAPSRGQSKGGGGCRGIEVGWRVFVEEADDVPVRGGGMKPPRRGDSRFESETGGRTTHA